MTDATIEIREFVTDDLDAVIAFSLRTWEPVFASVQAVLGDAIFLRLHPDWRVDQAEAVRSICTNDERDVYVAVADGRPVGFVAVALNAFHDRMGAIEIIGVHPDYQRCGIGERLTEASGRCAESVSDHPAAQGGRRLDLVAGVDEDLEQPDRRLVPDHGLPRRRLGRIAL